MENMVEVKKISKTFPYSKKDQKKWNKKDKVAVNEVSFSVKKGEVYALLGPNGAGKTTTLRCLATLLKPNQGEIILDNETRKEAIRKKISFLTSDLQLDKHFTPDYLFDYFSNLYGIKDNKDYKEELFKLLGIDQFRNVKIGDLSTGMKQKTSIAISLVHDPSLLIYDEPTNGLDILLAKEVIDYLRVLKEKGKTIILSTHILDVVEKLADKVGIINSGNLIFEGTIPELLSKTNQNTLEEAFFSILLGGEEK